MARRPQRETLLSFLPVEAVVNGSTPTAYVVSQNLHRRHLDESQRAMVGARMLEIYEAAAKQRQKRKSKDSVRENLPEQTGKATDQAGEAVKVSGKTVSMAATVLDTGAELIAAVDAGEIAVSKAAKLAKLPKSAAGR